MSEAHFIVYAGPDCDATFTVGESDVVIGREKNCDVPLRDDRASRQHASLVMEGDRVIIRDLESSNGTFVNGVLINETELQEGDLIEIGHTKIVYGSEPPTPDQERERIARKGRDTATRERVGAATQVMPGGAVPAFSPTQIHLSELLHQVAADLRSKAAAYGAHLSVEVALPNDIMTADGSMLRRALGEVLAELLRMPEEAPPDAETQGESTFELRAIRDGERDGIQIQLIWIGQSVAAERIGTLERSGAFHGAHEAALAHKGVLETQPTGLEGVLARLRLPGTPPEADQRTIIR